MTSRRIFLTTSLALLALADEADAKPSSVQPAVVKR